MIDSPIKALPFLLILSSFGRASEMLVPTEGDRNSATAPAPDEETRVVTLDITGMT